MSNRDNFLKLVTQEKTSTMDDIRERIKKRKNMEYIEVQIVSHDECKSLNPFRELFESDPEDYKEQLLARKKAESKRKTYKIISYKGVRGISFGGSYMGSIHQAQVNNETMEAIIL